MPSPKATLDLGAWADFLPQERSNDYEYNLLLYKFKSFYNEVRDYQRLHSNCSVTVANNSTDRNSEATQNFNLSSQNNDSANLSAISHTTNGDSSSGLPNANGQYVINLKKKLFQNQDSGLPNPREHLLKQHTIHQFHQRHHNSSYRQQQDVVATTTAQQYNSSHNLSSLCSSSVGNQIGLTSTSSNKPEIKQRYQHVSNSRLLLSKSSERLDNINNNHIPITSSLEERDLDTFHSSSYNAPIARDTKYLQNDDNIYDAVSPDDIKEGDNVTRNVTASVNDLNRLSFPQKSKLEPSKSSLALVSSKLSPILDKANAQTFIPKAIPSNKSTPNDSNDQERSNNSFSSSIVLDTSNNTSSSLSLNPNCTNQEYGNYVNIDFFLKRSQSPSFDDGLEGDSSDVSDDESTQMSHSLSSDQICDGALKNLSPKELAKKLSSHGHSNSSTSITPASSGDFLDESRNPTAFQLSSSISSTSKQQLETSNKYSSFFSPTNRDIDNSTKSSTTPRESSGSKISPQYHKTLEMIHENQAISSKQVLSIESSQLDSDGSALAEAHTTMRSFLSDLNLSPVGDIFEDKAQRRIVKESFAVEFCGRRKLRHLFLFNDVIVCAKYQASSKQKFTFDVKWYLNLNGVTVSDSTDANTSDKFNKEAIENQILAIRTNLMLLRGRMQQIKRSKDKKPSKIIKKLKKKRTELEADLVLLLPHLPLVIKHLNGKKYTFFLSSNFDRNQWIESIKFLQSQLPASKTSTSTPSSSELQAWIQTCRKNLNPSLGTFLLRSNCDDDLLYGDLYITTTTIKGMPKPGQYYFCFEVDSYGHFSQKASSAVLNIENTEHDLNDEYIFPLDGAHTLRILLYEDLGQNSKPSVVGKAHVELSRAWFLDKPVEKLIEFNSNCKLVTHLSFSNSELLSMRIPHAKLCPTFGLDITQVCKKEKTNVPLLVQLCVNEVERRGMREVGIYRMSGTSTDIQKLKKAFETNPYVAELLLRDIDINSVTGFLKQYLREMPEGLFINKLYPKFVAAFNIPQSESLERARRMLELFHKIPIANQHTIIYLVEHLVKVNQYENYNKMSLTNLATVLGPNILRPPTDSSSATSSDPFTAVVIGSMSQAGILYFFLNRKVSNLPLLELDSSELVARTST